MRWICNECLHGLPAAARLPPAAATALLLLLLCRERLAAATLPLGIWVDEHEL